MRKKGLTQLVAITSLAGFWLTGTTVICPAQDLLLGGVPDPQVLVSTPLNQEAGTVMETSLVDIKAVDAPGLHTIGNKTGIGAEQRFGQGIIIDADGIIATNRHIIGNPSHVFVSLANGQTFEASILSNSQPDLCLLKINTPFALRAIALADASEIQIGSKVTAIANAAFNHQRKLGGKIIQVFKALSSNKVELMEMNIPLKPGDSGGAVVNQEGSLLGLIMAKQISDPSKSYAIAANMIQQEYFKYRNSILN